MDDIDFQIVDVENELEKRREKENSKIVPAATGTSSNLSFGKMFLYFILGIIIFRIFVEVVSILSK
jgi:hypothetical protein